jgi:hypothetical protein
MAPVSPVLFWPTTLGINRPPRRAACSTPERDCSFDFRRRWRSGGDRQRRSRQAPAQTVEPFVFRPYHSSSARPPLREQGLPARANTCGSDRPDCRRLTRLRACSGAQHRPAACAAGSIVSAELISEAARIELRLALLLAGLPMAQHHVVRCKPHQRVGETRGWRRERKSRASLRQLGVIFGTDHGTPRCAKFRRVSMPRRIE